MWALVRPLQGEKRGGESLTDPRRRLRVLNILLCRCCYGRAACSKYWFITCCWCCVLACCWRWHYVGVAAAYLHWLACRLQLYIFDGNQLWDFERWILFSPVRGGYISIFTAQLLEWSCPRKVPTCDYCCCDCCDCCWQWWWCFVLVLLYIYCCCCCSWCSCCCSVLLICY